MMSYIHYNYVPLKCGKDVLLAWSSCFWNAKNQDYDNNRKTNILR